ncbi:hypothetical protein EAI_13551, partial [Harpegnathos saltator]
ARDSMGTCQCRYCDPSGLIWDVDRNGYSPWSDPTSYFSYEEIAAPARDVGVIGDRGQPDSSKRRTPWRGDSIGAPSNPSASTDSTGSSAGGVASPKGLEVSTEIITSPNGHRDLEIKFYSSPSPNAPVEREEDKSSSA